MTTLKKFLTFSFFGRLVGFLSDFVLVTLAASSFAFSFYNLSSFPLIVFSVIGYLTSLCTVFKKDINLAKPIFTAVLFISLLNSGSFLFLNSIDLPTAIFVSVILFFGYIFLERNDLGKKIIWLNPLLALMSGIAIIIFSLLSNHISLNIFMVLVLAFLIKPLIIILLSHENNTLKQQKLLSFITLILIILSLRHFLIISFRYFLPESELIDYSFNARITQSIFAIYAVSLIAQNKLIDRLFEIRSFYVSVVILFLLFLVSEYFETDPLRIKVFWVFGLLFACPYIVSLDIFIIKNFEKNRYILFLGFINMAIIFLFSYFLWMQNSISTIFSMISIVFYAYVIRKYLLKYQ